MQSQPNGNTTPDTEAKSNTDKKFAIQQVFLTNARFESAQSPYQIAKMLDKKAWSPKVETEIKSDVKNLEANTFEVTLGMLLTGKSEQGQTLFQIKLDQAGIFLIEGFNETEKNVLLRGYALNQLYPTLTARINELLMHAGFPPIMLTPIDFVNLYQQQQQNQQHNNAVQSPEHVTH